MATTPNMGNFDLMNLLKTKELRTLEETTTLSTYAETQLEYFDYEVKRLSDSLDELKRDKEFLDEVDDVLQKLRKKNATNLANCEFSYHTAVSAREGHIKRGTKMPPKKQG